ncbi:MAG: extracellular solute-binding protein [Hydrotalea sp.]|nr:extracellular solute-binding protein [Hydrotalea sp.]
MKKNLLMGLVFVAGSILTSTMGHAATPKASNLFIYDWAGYDDQSLFPDYVKKYGGKPKFAFYQDEEEAQAKLKTGFKADLVHPCGYKMNAWRAQGIVQPIDVSRIPNYKDLEPRLKNAPGFVADGKVWAIPYDSGQTSVVYNVDKVPAGDVASLSIFTNPKYKGKVSLPDNMADWVELGLVATGTKDWNSIKDANDPKFKKAMDFLRAAHKNTKFYWADTATLAQSMKNGEVLAAWSWNDAPTSLQAEGVNVKFAFGMKEGYTGYVCGYMIPKTSKANDQVYDFLNAVVSKESASALVNIFGYSHANMVGMKAIDSKVFAQKNMATGALAKREVIQTALRDDLITLFAEEFNKVKSGK